MGFVPYFPFTEDESCHIRKAEIQSAFLAYIVNDLACTQLSKPRLNILNEHSIFFLELKL